MNKALQLQNISIRLGTFQLSEVTLSLETGDYLVVMGPSGCGKTTLLRIICGLLSPMDGSLQIGGADALFQATSKRRASYVPQSAALFPHLSVRQNIEFGQKYVNASQFDKQRTFEHIVHLLGLESLLTRYPQGLSGGEGKKVALARAIVTDPLLLLLDEPLGMLDKPARDEMTQVLGKLHSEIGTTAIHVTHDREEARALGTTCCVMDNGRIVQTGSYENITAHPATKFVADFIGLPNVFAYKLTSANGEKLVQTPLGSFPADTFGQSTGLVHFPPHGFTLSSNPNKAIAGEIIEISPRGHVLECIVQINSTTKVSVQLKSSDTGQLKRGDSVNLVTGPPVMLCGNEGTNV